MNKTLIEFKKHFEDKTTLVFQYNDEKYIINGCQIFLEGNKDTIFEEFEVDLKYQNDVNEALASLNDNVNEEELLYIIETYNEFIKFVEHEHQTYDMALITVKKWGGNLMYIRKDLQDYNMAMVVVKDWSRCLQYVREDLQTEELCEIAIQDNKIYMKYIKCTEMKKKFEKMSK